MERTVVPDPDSISRNKDRHSHIGIRLQYRVNEQWGPVEALGWNEVGFNFYHVQEISESALELRRGLARFTGSIVWRARDANDELLRSMVLNELIYKRAKEVVNDEALRSRLLKLIRASGMATEKRKILDSLGLAIPDATITEMVEQKKQAPSLFHYGVKIESEAWAAVVGNALSVSSVLVSLEKWSGGLSKKPV